MNPALAPSATSIKFAYSVDEYVDYAYQEFEEALTITPPLGFSVSLYSTAFGKWVAEDAASGIFGCGESAASAARDFLVAAREHLEVLEASEPLAPHLREQLDYLRSRLS